MAPYAADLDDATSTSRVSKLHAELPCFDIMHMFQLLKQRRHNVQEKRQDFLREEDCQHQRLATKRKACDEDEVTMAKQPRTIEFSRLFTGNMVPSPVAV